MLGDKPARFKAIEQRDVIPVTFTAVL